MLHRLKVVFVILFLFIFHAQTVAAQGVSLPVTPTPTPIEYQLPYPGILPGHPFYFLKNIRDSLMSFMISSPLKKAEFELLQADKNLQAAVYLFEQNKDSKIIFETLQKSKEHFSNAVERAQEAKKQGVYTVDFAAKITIANLKHREVVLNLSKSAKTDDKKKFETSLEHLKKLSEKAKALNPK